MSVPPGMMAALMGQGTQGMSGMQGNGMQMPFNMNPAINPTGAGTSVQPSTGMMAAGPNLQQPGMGGNPALAAQQGAQPGAGMSQAQKMMMAQTLMGLGQQRQPPPQAIPMNVGRNT